VTQPTSPSPSSAAPLGLREAFLLDPKLVFLNHGSYGACPREVLAAHHAWQFEMERNPVEFLGRRSAQLLAEARAVMAVAVNAPADDLAFVSNATTGVNIVTASLAKSGWLKPGDEVLGTDHEYGACEAAWQVACAATGATYRRVTVPLPFDSTACVDHLMAAVTPRTRVVFASHITSTTALVFPVAALCAAARARGLFTLIDGAHAPGQIDVDLGAIAADAYTGNAHKWWCAPKGAAFLHLRPQHHALISGSITSWGDVAESLAPGGLPSAFDGYTGTGLLQRRLQWQGTRDLAAWLTVPAALAFQHRHDWPDRRAECHRMAVALMHRVAASQGLPPIAPDDAFAQMVAIPVRHRDGDALRRHLFEQHRIEVPTTQHAGQTLLRVSVQAYNTAADLQKLEAALEDAPGRG
jgi:isopenicillin-N epimerase